MLASTVAGPMLLAGAVAIAATVAVERLGPRTGGLVATLPTTIVPAGWGMWAGSDGPAAFYDAMGAVPVGMALNAVFLASWRVLPARLPGGSLQARLAWMTTASLGLWAVLAALATVGLDALRASGVWMPHVGAVFFAGTLAVGAWMAHTAPKSRGAARHVAPLVLLARGAMAALAIGVATALAGVGAPVLAAMASVFPAIFLTTMVALWWSHGDAVPAGAVGPMMLGSASVSAYALVAGFTLPAFGVTLGSLAAWGLAVVLVTVPAWLWLRR